MIPNFGFVVENRLAGCAHPGWGDMLRETLEEMVEQHGITAIVTLTSEALDEEELRDFHLRSHHMPVADFGVPRIEAMHGAVEWIRKHVESGGRVVVHCAGGYGRTGTLLACCLVRDGLAADDAIARVRQCRPGSIETPQQEHFVRQWQEWLASNDGKRSGSPS